MSYEARDQQTKRDATFQALKAERLRDEKLVANWMDKATALHADSPLQSDKDEIVAQRDGFKASLRLALGV